MSYARWKWNQGTHWSTLYSTDRRFYDLAYSRATEYYPEFYDPEEAPTAIPVVIGSRSAELTLKLIDAEVVSLYGWGYCSLLALAIHDLTGAPLVLHTSKQGTDVWVGHASVLVGENKYLDIEGVNSVRAINSRYRFNIIPKIVTREEFCSTIATEEHVANPFSWLDELERLLTFHFAEEVITQYASKYLTLREEVKEGLL